MKRLICSLLLLLAALTFAEASHAAPTRPLPAAGLWWEVPYTGRVYHIEVSPSGYVHVVMTIAGRDVDASVRTAQGDLQLQGNAALLQSPLYQLENVSPLAFSATGAVTTKAPEGAISMRFVTPEQAIVRLAGLDRVIERTQLLTSEADRRSVRLAKMSYFLQIGAQDFAGVTLRAQGQPRCVDAAIPTVAASTFALDCASCSPPQQHVLAAYELQIESSQSERMRLYRADAAAPNACTLTHAMSESRGFVRGQNIDGDAHIAMAPVLATMGGPAQSFGIWPSTGLWWETPYTGRVYHIDVSPLGYLHSLLSVAGNSVAASARSAQGFLSVSNNVYNVSSPLYQFENVAPLGKVQTIAATRPSAEGAINLRFQGLEQAVVRLDGRDVTLQRTQLIQRLEDTRGQRLPSAHYRLQLGDKVFPNVALERLSQPRCPQAPERVNTEAFKLTCTDCAAPELADLELQIDRTQSEAMRVVDTTVLPALPPITVLSCSRLLCNVRCQDGAVVSTALQPPTSACPAVQAPACQRETHVISEMDGVIRGLGAAGLHPLLMTPN
jgi:hypothetical protein